MGNLDVNSKKVQLFSDDHRLLYEADFYEGEELDEQFFSYNEAGNLTRDRRVFHKDHECGDYRMTYDAKENLVSEVNMDEKGKEIEKKSMTYDKNGNMLTHQVEFYHESTSKMIVESSFTFTYDGSNKLISKIGFEGEKEDRIYTYKYESSADSESITKYEGASKKVEKWMTKNDANGMLLQDVHTKFQDGKGISKTIDFTYDQHGHILKEELTKTGSSIKKSVNFEYSYDAFGNWTERKEFKKSGARESQGAHLKRIIEYYEESDYKHPPMEMDESYNYENREGKSVKVFQESHVRINNNNGELEWVVRRNGSTLYQVDEYEYEEGKLVRINHLNNEKKANLYTLVRYNQEGLASEEVSFSSNGDVNEKLVLTYTKDGKLKTKEDWEGEKNILTETYTYDSKSGKIVSAEVVEFEDKIAVTYEYDENGSLVKVIEIPNGKTAEQEITEFGYIEKVLITERSYEGKAKKPYEELRYTYDGKAEISKKAVYRQDKIRSEIDFTYFE
ncbi:MAG: hypothetical protein ACI857_003221 [Arenicella sp.]|jgi:hypothetical protein